MSQARKLAQLILCLVAIGPAASALGETLDFEAFGIGDYPVLTTGGMDFAPTARNAVGIVPSGNERAISPKWGDTMALTPSGGSTFALHRLSHAGYWANVSSRVDVTGIQRDGTRLMSSFTYDAGSWNVHVLNWEDLVRVEFATPGGRVMLDDIDVTLSPLDPTAVIDFEDLPAGTYAAAESKGFDLVPQVLPIVDVLADGTNQSLSHKWGDSLVMTRSDGETFSLTSVDYRGRWRGTTGRLEVYGLRADGTRVDERVDYDGLSWRTLTLDWSDLVGVEFATPDGRVLLDNLDTDGSAQPPPSGCTPTAREATMLALVNQARASARQCGSSFYPAAAPLAWNCDLRQAATRHSEDMAGNDFFDHTGSDGSTIRERVTDTGYAWSRIAENIAAGYRSEAAVVAAWLDSAGHCANIMGPAYVDMGSSLVETNQASYPTYWTQVFGTPR